MVQDVIVLKDLPFKTVDDLRGKKFGTFSTGAGSFKAARAAMIEAFKLDVTKDAQLQQVAGPALTKLLEAGQVDAMINISSLNLAAEAQTDKFRVLCHSELRYSSGVSDCRNAVATIHRDGLALLWQIFSMTGIPKSVFL